MVIMVILSFMVTGCDFTTAPAGENQEQASTLTNTYGAEMRRTEDNQAKLVKLQPATLLDWSLERDNLNRKNQLWNNPNKIGYVYLFSPMGAPIGYYVIKGKVSSVNSLLTAPSQIVTDPINRKSSGYHDSMTVESPDLDGSYGTNGDAIFFFTTDGKYVQTPLPFLLSDAPIAINAPVLYTAPAK